MQLRLKCPVCQAKNLLTIQACSSCGASLEKLPPAQRVYVLEGAGAPSPKPAPGPAAAKPAAPGAAAKKPAKAKQPRKKKGAS